MKRREFITPLESAARNPNATKQKEEVPKKDGPEALRKLKHPSRSRVLRSFLDH